MNEEERLKQYKKEFYDEISKVDVSCENLKKCKISNDVLAAEISLRELFGDEIYKKQKVDDTVGGEKTIVKLDEDAIERDNQIREICEQIADVEFDNNVGLILAKSVGDED